MIMKRILLRAAQSPFDNLTAFDTMCGDKIWSNVGNLVFSQSVYKSLYSKDTHITIMNKPARTYEAEYINENFDMVLLPFANAFRKDYISKLNGYTDLIKKLRIPVVVVGIGAQARLSDMNSFDTSYDDDVIEFVKAVLERSCSIGVRGEYTYQYLKRLGFEKHTRIIGCPSMYMYGDILPKQIKSNHTFRLNINAKGSDSAQIRQYLFNPPCKSVFIAQATRELKMLYTGAKIKNDSSYPYRLDSPILDNTHMRFPLSVQGWIELLQKGNMSIGTRIHGSIVSVLAGLPTFLICTDSRTLELAEYHNIPHCMEKDFDFDRSIYEIYDSVDFTQIYKGHSERYEYFKKFMQENGIEISKKSLTLFEEKCKKIKWRPSLKPITEVGKKEMLRRLNLYYDEINSNKKK